MFDLLKKKITGLVGNITKTISKEERPATTEESKSAPSITEQIQHKPEPQIPILERPEPRIQEPKHELKEVPKPIIEKKELEELDIILEKKHPTEAQKNKERVQTSAEKTKTNTETERKEKTPESINRKSAEQKQDIAKKLEKETDENLPRKPEPELFGIQRKEELKEANIKVKPSFFTKVKSFISPEVIINEKDISSAMEDFELQLLIADVALPVAEEIISELKRKLIGKTVKSNEIESYIKKSLYESISDVIKQDRLNLIDEISKSKSPYKILFIGPNGAGKTTTIAKVAHYLKKNGKSCVISASDTFRAAAIEQTIEHAKKLGIPFIKHDYGSDPAAVAFDAVKYAEAKNIDVVLIDSAGRQETNRNLIEQLKKIERVTSPNLKIFVGEGITGNALLGQVSEFNNAIKLNGVILTKLDVDAKGGTVISVKKATGVPLIFIGVGQEYDDLLPFDEKYIINRIMSA